MSPSVIADLVAGVWLVVVLCVALDTLLPLMVSGPTPKTPRKLIRLAALTAGLVLVLRVAFSVGSLA